MLIRSQNKQVLVNIEQINTIEIESIGAFNKIVAYNGRYFTSIGFYTQGERAYDVLNDIWTAYGMQKRLYAMPQDDVESERKND